MVARGIGGASKMPIRIFEKSPSEDAQTLELRVNQWMDELDARSIKNVTAAPTQGNGTLCVVIWFEER
jgi:hypothetical protein